MSNAKTIAIIGNPNSGKTTLFNALTGARQRVGNWPGVTVERKTGHYQHANQHFEMVDLPGTYSLAESEKPVSIDEQIAVSYLNNGGADLVLNVIDASSLARGLYLTTQLLELDAPVVVALNMMDVAQRNGITVNPAQLSQSLGCPVIPLIASHGEGVKLLKSELAKSPCTPLAIVQTEDSVERYRTIDTIVEAAIRSAPIRRTTTDVIDAVVLNRFLAFPIFLAVMYLMFMFTINVGSAFIDFFDIVGNALFVDGPRTIFENIGLPSWLTAFLADGVGGGLQLVGTFIPIIGCLFFFLSFLEDSGYMGRIAFILDRVMQKIGLPGKSFVPLIVGFGCNVPAVMATRTLDREPDRILTTVMAPYMSCGARLTVYALFAAAFFPSNGQNIVFALYLSGILVAVLSALAVRKQLTTGSVSTFVMELPPYHLPTIKGMLIQTWQKLKGFVLRAGKAIVLVVIVLNLVSSVGTDGSFGNQNKDNSMLSAIGKTITPVFHPMGIDEDNWPATVGIFAGIFAKEVVVGTLDALYAGKPSSSVRFDLYEQLESAWSSIGTNFASIGKSVNDPLGIGIAGIENTNTAAAEQGVEINTIQSMRGLFHGELGAFSYLLFILLYMPCVATIGVIYKEIGRTWAIFSTGWSVVIAYGMAVLCYQIGTFPEHPASSLGWGLSMTFAMIAAFKGLIYYARKNTRTADLIKVVNLR